MDAINGHHSSSLRLPAGLLEAFPGAACVVADADLTICDLNRCYAALLEAPYRRGEAIGVPLERALPAPLREAWLESHRQARGGEAVLLTTCRCPGGHLWEGRVAPLLDEDHRAAWQLVTLVDVTSRRTAQQSAQELAATLQHANERLTLAAIAAEQAAERQERLVLELRRTRDDLSAADRRKDEFLAMLGHELRNPLAAILNACQILDRGKTQSSATAQLIGMIERQSRQLARMVDDLLDLARIARAQLELRRVPLDVREAVARAVETSQPFISAQEHQLTVQLPEEPLVAEVDPARLEQILGNLLHNAAKYTPPRGQVRLAASREGEQIVVEIEDTGVGIPEEDLPRVFEPFLQAHRDLPSARGGLGLGLSLVRSLVRLHGGSVEARSRGPGRGSTFVVRLPRS